jgi:O-antigen/teichoic acid export membrane protein
VASEHTGRIGSSPDSSKDSGEARPESIARNTAFSMAVQLTSAAFTAALTIILVRALATEEFGLFALALSVGALLTVPSDLGISSSAARFVAEHRGDEAAVGAVLARALRLKLAVSGAASVGLVAAAELIAEAYGGPGLAAPLRGIGIAVFGQSMMLLFGGVFIAQGRTSRNFSIVLSESATEFAASVVLVLLGTGATGAAFGRAVGYSVGVVLGIVLTLPLLRRARRAGGERVPRTGRIARYAGVLAVVDSVYTSLHYVDSLVIGALLNPTAVAFFQAPLRLIAFLNYPGAALASGVAPRMARGREPPNVPAFVNALRLLIILGAGICAVVVAWAGPIVELLFGASYAEGGEVLRALAPYIFLSGLAPLVSIAANYLGVAGGRIPIALASLVVNLGLDLLLIPEWGVVGAGVATSAAFCIYVPAHLYLCRRVIPLPLAPLAVTLVRAALAGAACAGVLAALGTSDLSAGSWVAGAVAAPTVFAGLLALLGEVTHADLELLRTTFWLRLRRAESP